MSGFVLMVFGGYYLSTLNFLGIVAFIAGFGLFFSRFGVQIDLINKTRREFIGLFRFKMGKWKPLPKIEYVTVFTEHYMQRESVATIDNVQRISKLNVRLIVSNTERYEAGNFHDKEKALEAGRLIAKKLGTKLLDYTEKEPKWVELD